jgi:hypothetical protein
MLLKVEICQVCADSLRKVLTERGKEAMCKVAGPILQACPTCGPKLPQCAGTLVTYMKKETN